MLIQAHKIDADGYVVEAIDPMRVSEYDSEDIVTVCMPNGLYKPRWIGTEWVEDATQEYIDEMTNVKVEPTAEERIVQLEQENTLLKAQNNALAERTDFHEEVLTEIILSIAP